VTLCFALLLITNAPRRFSATPFRCASYRKKIPGGRLDPDDIPVNCTALATRGIFSSATTIRATSNLDDAAEPSGYHINALSLTVTSVAVRLPTGLTNSLRPAFCLSEPSVRGITACRTRDGPRDAAHRAWLIIVPWARGTWTSSSGAIALSPRHPYLTRVLPDDTFDPRTRDAAYCPPPVANSACANCCTRGINIIRTSSFVAVRYALPTVHRCSLFLHVCASPPSLH